MSEKTYVVAGNYDEFLFNVKNKLQRLYAEGDTRFTMSDFVYVSSVTLRSKYGCLGLFQFQLSSFY